MTQPKLVECPFCNNAPRHLEAKAGFYTERVICDHCHFHLEETATQTAVERWNTRSSEESKYSRGPTTLRLRQPPAGWVMVPVEPTTEMLQAGRNEPLATQDEDDSLEDYRAVYRAMLTAVPGAAPVAQGDAVLSDSVIKRYKIGYHTDEWGVLSSTPGGIADPSGQWVLYKDHLAALASHRQAPATQQTGWTNADADAARLALELECLLMDTKDTAVVSKWWQSANEALELHRARLQEVQPSPTPQAGADLADEIDALLAARAAPGEPVHGDTLPPVGSRVYIRHGRDNDAHACVVTGYYAWGDLGGDKRLHRVFVRLVYEGTDIQQARMLCDCYPTAEAALAQAAPAAQGDARAEEALLKVLLAVQRYLPPDGPSAKDTLTEIIGIVDPWPLDGPKGNV